ncbi:hypothetical protein CPER28S_00920 [Cellulomonas persica]
MGSSAPPETNCASCPAYVTGISSGASPAEMMSDFFASQSDSGALVMSNDTCCLSRSSLNTSQSLFSG